MSWRSGRRAAARSIPLFVAVALATGLVALVAPPPARADPLPSNPILIATPDCFAADGPQTVTVHGRNFERNTTVVVTDYVYYQRPDAEVAAQTSDYGTFEATLNVTADSYYYYNKIEVKYEFNIEGDPLATVFVGGCGNDREVTAITSCGDPDNPSIRVIGARYAPAGQFEDIVVELRQGDLTIGEGTTARAAETFDVTFSPGVTLEPGEYTIVATQRHVFGRITLFGYDRFFVPCPQVTVNPVCEPSGVPPDRMSIFVSGTGFLPDTGSEGEDELEIVFSPELEPQEFVLDTFDEGLLLDDGSFTDFEINPYRRPDGIYTIQVKQSDFGGVMIEQFVSFTVPCAPTTITVDDDCGPPQLLGDEPRRYDLTVTGAEFDPLLEVVITFDPEGLAGPEFPPEEFRVTAERDRTFTLEIDPRYRPPGTYAIVAVQQRLTGALLQADAEFRVPCREPAPSLTIKESCGPAAAGQPQAYEIQVRGAGFVTGPVELLFDGEAPPPGTPPVVAGPRGGFLVTLLANGRPPGTYEVVATQSTVRGVLARASAPFLVSCDGVLLRITPTRGPRGFVPLVEGFNFTANTTLLLRWDRGIGAANPISVVTDANGKFEHQVVIFRSDFVGLRRYTVELPDDPLAYPDVFAEYSVTQPPVSPPFRIVDNPYAAPDATIVLR